MKYHVPRLSRRDLLKFGSLSVAGYSLLPMLRPLNVEAKEKSKPRGGAEICIFLFLQGAPAQMDTFDAKEGSGTPEDFDFRTNKHGVKMSAGTIERWLVGQTDAGMAASTRNSYREAAVCFGNWCCRTHRLTHNPVGDVPRANQNVDLRHYSG